MSNEHGRPRRTERLPVVFYPSEVERYEHAARKQGVRFSDWVRDALNAGAARQHVMATEGGTTEDGK